MPEIGMSVSMSGDGKRSVGHRPQATAPILDSTIAVFACTAERLLLVREVPGGSGLRRSVTSPGDWNLTLVQFDRDLSKRAFCCDLCSHSNLFPRRGKLICDHVYQA